jgi:hypothetical protein
MNGSVHLKDKAIDGRMTLKWCENVKWIHLAPVTAQYWAPVNTV